MKNQAQNQTKKSSIKLQKLWGTGIKGFIYKILVGTRTWGSFQKLKSINIGDYVFLRKTFNFNSKNIFKQIGLVLVPFIN
jgi:hypothetical protein